MRSRSTSFPWVLIACIAVMVSAVAVLSNVYTEQFHAPPAVAARLSEGEISASLQTFSTHIEQLSSVASITLESVEKLTAELEIANQRIERLESVERHRMTAKR